MEDRYKQQQQQQQQQKVHHFEDETDSLFPALQKTVRDLIDGQRTSPRRRRSEPSLHRALATQLLTQKLLATFGEELFDELFEFFQHNLELPPYSPSAPPVNRSDYHSIEDEAENELDRSNSTDATESFDLDVKTEMHFLGLDALLDEDADEYYDEK
jgi:hypothetical protein